MKTQKLNLDAFTANELTKNQKKTVLGKGDSTMQYTPFAVLSTTTTTTPIVPPGSGSGNGDAKIVG